MVRSALLSPLAFAVFILWAGILVTAGVLTGMSAVEYVPTALIEGLVLGGLLVVARMPGEARPDDDGGGNDRLDPSPSAAPSPASPPAWWDRLGDIDAADASTEDVIASQRKRQPAAASR